MRKKLICLALLTIASSSQAAFDFNFSAVKDGGNADNATIQKLEPAKNTDKIVGKTVYFNGRCTSPDVEQGVSKEEAKYDIVTCSNDNGRILVSSDLAGRQFLTSNFDKKKIIQGKVIDVSAIGSHLIVKPVSVKEEP
jgi:hypothetical protein